MPKDYKIGMLCGLAVVIVAGLWLSMHPGLSMKAGISGPENARSEPNKQPRFEPNMPTIRPVVKEVESEREEITTAKTPKYHIIRSGDTLSGISYQYYGTENKWQKILDANRDVIQDVKNLRLGTRLIIPE